MSDEDIREAIIGINGISEDAIEMGLTTPGQDLYSEQRDRGRGGS